MTTQIGRPTNNAERGERLFLSFVMAVNRRGRVLEKKKSGDFSRQQPLDSRFCALFRTIASGSGLSRANPQVISMQIRRAVKRADGRIFVGTFSRDLPCATTQ